MAEHLLTSVDRRARGFHLPPPLDIHIPTDPRISPRGVPTTNEEKSFDTEHSAIIAGDNEALHYYSSPPLPLLRLANNPPLPLACSGAEQILTCHIMGKRGGSA